MKIRSQYIISIAIFGIVLAIIAASVLITDQQVAQINNEAQTSTNVQIGASSLSYISNAYFLNEQNIQVSEWQNQFSSMSNELAQLNPSSLQDKALVSTVESDLQSLGTIFNDSVSYVESAPQSGSGTVSPVLQLDNSRLAVQNQALAFDSSVLTKNLNNQANQLKETSTILIFALLGVFGAYFISVYFLVYRRTLSSIAKLQEGTKIIGSGNLDYAIAAQSNDEVGELSIAFNQMTANLKTVTASKTDLEQAQSSLKASEQRWATTLASIGDAVIAADLSGKIMFMNGEAEELTGWKLSEASQKPVKEVFNIVNEQTRLEVENPIEKVLKEGIVVGLANHTVLIQKDGAIVPIDDSGAPIKDKDGKTTGVVLIFRDISERKKAGEEVARIASFPLLNPNPIFEVDFDGNVTYSNPATKTNFPDLETLGSAHPLLSDWQNAVKAFESKPSSTFNREVKVGEQWYYQQLYLVPNTQHIRIYTINITERKKAEEATAKQAELIDLSPDAIIVQQPNGTITFWSRGAEKLYGWTKKEVIGKDIHTLLKSEFPRPLEEILNKIKLEGAWSGEIVHTSKDERKVVVQSYWLGKTGADGKIVELLESNVEITERIELQVKLEESAVRVEEYANQMEELANKRLAQLKDSERLAAIGATAGMVGHDIRNPLQAITGDIYLAKSELDGLPDGEEKKAILESLIETEKNIDYINKIVQDLQDYARPLNPKIEESDVKLVVESLIAKSNLPKNIKATVKVADDARKVNADSYYLNRILYNLVTNSVQAMPEGGKLTIKAYKEAKDTVISVSDTGVGIPENVRDKMFTLMFTTKSKGQGFGLPVVKRMTESLGGTVTFESEQGKGTKFIIRLPPPKKS